MNNLPDIVTIDISNEDVENGNRKCACDCPVARAIKRHFNNEYDVTVGPFATKFGATLYHEDELERLDDGAMTDYTMSEEQALVVKEYDKGSPFLLTQVTLTKVKA